jgi:DNA polymerase-3 subunit gamma/tau
MSQALYRKWRPGRFGEVVGQEHITRTLQNAVAGGRIGHAYLFSGPRGTGKTTTARILAKAANCSHQELAERPCNACRPCEAVNEGRYLDLIEIDAASNTSVEDVRELRERIHFSPGEGRYKVYIIDEVHMLSAAAFNALLKTLEEPPPHAIFILATTEEHKVPLTIRSRCQQFAFRLLTTAEIASRLNWLAERERLVIEPDAVAMIAEYGAGSLRDAESLLDQLLVAPGEEITLRRAQMILGTAPAEALSALVDAWLDGDGPAGLGSIHDALATGADARQFARQMVAYLRQLLLIQTSGRNLVSDAPPDRQAKMWSQAARAERPRLIEAIKHFNSAATVNTGGWQPQLPLELAFVELLPPAGSPVPAPTYAASPAQPAAAREPEPVSQQPDATAAPSRRALDEAAARAPALERLAAIWPQLRERVGRQDKGLPALLAACKPLAIEGEAVILGFDYPLLKEKFDAKPGAAAAVARALGDLLGASFSVRSVLSEEYVAPAPAVIAPEELADLARQLGGVVREG